MSPSDGEEAVWTDFLVAGQAWLPSLDPTLFGFVELVALTPCEVDVLPAVAFSTLTAGSALWAAEHLHAAHCAVGRLHVRRAIDALGMENRLALFWWALSRPDDEGVRVFEGRIPQHIVASYLKVSREEVSRKTQVLERAGYVKVETRRVLVYPDVAFLLGHHAEWTKLFDPQ